MENRKLLGRKPSAKQKQVVDPDSIIVPIKMELRYGFGKAGTYRIHQDKNTSVQDKSFNQNAKEPNPYEQTKVGIMVYLANESLTRPLNATLPSDNN